METGDVDHLMAGNKDLVTWNQWYNDSLGIGIALKLDIFTGSQLRWLI